MAGSSASDFAVASSSGEYTVRFVEDIVAALGTTLEPGDVLIIDRLVLKHHGQRLKAALDTHRWIVCDAGEETKSYAGLVSPLESLIEGGFRRGQRLVGVGGGVIQDVTAFIASILFRGVDWLFVPTTLLAQGDSCIGSKTSINFAHYKNQLGGFHPPRGILIDLEFLRTLPEREMLSGLGEMAHYFPIAGEDAFERFAADLPLARGDSAVLRGIIRRSLEIKKAYVEVDEFDRKERQVFNYGHSFGHALESVTSYRVPHGIAVAVGMDMANDLSVRLGFLSPAVRERMRSVLQGIWEGVGVESIDRETYLAALKRDKKNRGEQLGLILTSGFGRMFKHFVTPDAAFVSWLGAFLENEIHSSPVTGRS
jgi:3-dehydroquinate synthase